MYPRELGKKNEKRFYKENKLKSFIIKIVRLGIGKTLLLPHRVLISVLWTQGGGRCWERGEENGFMKKQKVV